jgi:4-amino-4-deoxy-L-arabinose transferase-like glycosyltransferase
VSRRARLAAYALLVLGWGLRLRNLGGPELWFDEAASHFIAVRSPADILSYVAAAPFEHPPFYYLLLHGAMRLFGDSEWALRFPSVLLSMVLLVGLWRAGLVLGRPALALATLGAAAVSPFLVTYAQEARMYALVQVLGLGATALLYLAYHRGGVRYWLAYAAVLLVGIATHYFFAFLLPAHLLILGVVGYRRGLVLRYVAPATLLLAGVGTAVVALAPGPRAAAEQMLREGLWGKSPEAIGRLLQDWAYGGATITSRPAWAPTLSLLALGLVLAGLTHPLLSRRIRVALGLWVAVPALLAVIVPYGGLVLRHFSYVAPALSLLTAAGLLQIGRRSRALIPVGLLALGLTAVPGLAWQADHPKGHYRDALAHVAAHALPGDLILLGNPHQWVPFTYYNLTGLPHESVAAGRPLPDEAVASADRIWVLEWETWATDDMAAIWEELLGQATIAYRLDLSSDVRLSLLYPTPDSRPQTLPGPTWDEARSLAAVHVYPATGQAVLASLCWSGSPPSDATTAVVLRLSDPQGRTWAQTVQPPGLSRPRNAGDTCTRHALSLSGGIPPGQYTLDLGLVDLTSGAQLAATGPDGVALGPWASLGSVTVKRTSYPPPPVVGGAAGKVSPGVTFVGSETDAEALVAGSYWEGFLQFAVTEPVPEATLLLRLRSGRESRTLDLVPLAAAGLPVSEWQPGETWRCPYRFRLPPDLPPGEYRLEVGPPGGGPSAMRLPWVTSPWLEVDRFRVEARTPNVVDSQPEEPLDVVFGGAVRLKGYTLVADEAGGVLRLRLYWEGIAPTDEPHKVFVHLARPGEGEPLAQDDAPPAPLPTSEWQPGETWVSEHTLALPADVAELVLRVGLYSERTMARLPASGPSAQADHLEVALGPLGTTAAP